MKKTLLLGLAVILFTACQEVKPDRYTVNSPEIDATKALIKEYHDGDWENWVTHYADTAKVYHNSTESMSPKQLKDGFTATLANYSSYSFSSEEIFYEMVIDDKNNTWVYFWGTWEGIMNETNTELKVPVHLALQFVDGKIVEEYAYYDTSPMAAAMKEKEEAEKMPEEE